MSSFAWSTFPIRGPMDDAIFALLTGSAAACCSSSALKKLMFAASPRDVVCSEHGLQLCSVYEGVAAANKASQYLMLSCQGGFKGLEVGSCQGLLSCLLAVLRVVRHAS